MAIIIVTPDKKLSKSDFDAAREDYQSYIKITIDVEKEIVALGGEWHADTEIKLTESGGDRKNIWGGGVDLETGEFETNAMINIRAGRNDSTEILDNKIKEKFLKIAKKVLKNHV